MVPCPVISGNDTVRLKQAAAPLAARTIPKCTAFRQRSNSSANRLAGHNRRVRAAAAHDARAVHEDHVDTSRPHPRVGRRGVVADALAVEDGDVGGVSLPEEAPPRNAHALGVLAGHAVHGVLQRKELPLPGELQKSREAAVSRRVLQSRGLHPGVGHEVRGPVLHERVGDLRIAVFVQKHARGAVTPFSDVDVVFEISHLPLARDIGQEHAVELVELRVVRRGELHVGRVEAEQREGYLHEHAGLFEELWIVVRRRHLGHEPFGQNARDDGRPAVVCIGVETHVDAVVDGAVDERERPVQGLPGARADEDEVRYMHAHARLPGEVQELPEGLQVVRLAEGFEGIGARDRREGAHVDRYDAVARFHQARHLLLLGGRGEDVGRVSHPERNAPRPPVHRLGDEPQRLVHLGPRHRGGIVSLDGNARGAVPAEVHQVGPHAVPLETVEVLVEAVPGDAVMARLEEVVFQEAPVRGALFKARGAEAAVPSHEGGDALLEEGGDELGPVGRDEEPVVVRVDVDKARGDDLPSAVDGLALRIDPAARHIRDRFPVDEQAAGVARLPRAVYDEAVFQ
jgi:hypothetical protein